MPGTDQPVLILGGGINGAAIARELTLQGVSVWLVDRNDLNTGATAYSTRLIHGGLRYLEYAEFDLVRESLEERNRLLQNAPDFVRPLKLYIPTTGRLGGLVTTAARFLRVPARWTPASQARGLWLVRAGLRFYDQFATASSLPRHSIHRLDEPDVPAVGIPECRWLCAYYDAQIAWPERFVIAQLQDAQAAAAERGADFRVFPHTSARRRQEVVELRRSAWQGSEAEAAAEPFATEPFETVRPLAIINATGAWVDETLATLDVPYRRLMRGTKGSHVVTHHTGLRACLGDGGVYAEAADGRPVFVLPFGDATLIGTTDLPFEGDPAEAVATEDEIEYLLEAASHLFPQAALERVDVTLHMCGVRPLPDVSAKSAAAVTRRHWLERHPDAEVPTYSVIGGKLTTCRSLAEQTVRTLMQSWGRPMAESSRERPLVERTPQVLELGQAAWNAASEGKVRRVIQDEWVERLIDLVERRAMLHYRPNLDRSLLGHLADVLIAEGRLGADQRTAAINECVHRLTTHYGRQV